MQPSHSLFCVATVVGLSVSADQAMADKVDVVSGVYSLAAKNSSGTIKISNVGKFGISYYGASGSNINYTIGYTIYSLGVDSSDLGFGVDLGVVYFPLNASQAEQRTGVNSLVVFYDSFRPFVGLSYHQRQFQAIQANYVGLGVSIGAEYQFVETYHLTGRLQGAMLNGPLSSHINEISVVAGVGMTL